MSRPNEASISAMSEAPEPSIQLLAEAAENESRAPINPRIETAEQDDRSSSLSDLEDRQGTDATDKVNEKSLPASDDDTEAETERLEATPHKLRRQRHVILGTADPALQDTARQSSVELAPSQRSSPLGKPETREQDYALDALDPTSEISSLEDSAEGGSGLKSPASTSSRKRKRDEDSTVHSLKRAAFELASHIADQSDSIEPVAGAGDAGYDHGGAIETADVSEEEVDESGEERAKEGTAPMEIEQEASTPRSVEEDEDMEDVGPEPDASSAARSEEELLKKKSALDLLSVIEKDFALLRDRLFSARTKQLNEELATLEGPNITHPDYLAMVKSISQQQLKRFQLAKKTFDYKCKALQKKCVADRAQIHSQYAQTVREVRDESLRAANRECYQIQQERRALDRHESAPLNHMPKNRSELVAYQNAYNMEVSILSGVAKYVGFPAAPEIEAANTDERDADLRKMGIDPQQLSASRPVPQLHRPPRPAAEEQGPEQTPLVNQRHPSQAPMANGAPRQATAQNHLPSPITPFPPRRPADAPLVNGSGSTIPAMPSSSHAPTPMSVDLSSTNSMRANVGSTIAPTDTPSRPPVLTDQAAAPSAPSETIKDAQSQPNGSSEAVTSEPAPPQQPPSTSNAEALATNVQSSPNHVSAQPKDTLIGPRADRTPLHGGFGQPPSLAAEVKVGNA